MDDDTKLLWKMYAESLVRNVNSLVNIGVIKDGVPHNIPIDENTGRKMMITITLTERK